MKPENYLVLPAFLLWTSFGECKAIPLLPKEKGKKVSARERSDFHCHLELFHSQIQVLPRGKQLAIAGRLVLTCLRYQQPLISDIPGCNFKELMAEDGGQLVRVLDDVFFYCLYFQ